MSRFRPRYLSFAALALLVLPFALAFITSLFTEGDMWNEGTGGGAWLWMLFLSIPGALPPIPHLNNLVADRDIKKRGN
jgi:hypothetical protein